MGSKDYTAVGRPIVADASVRVAVEAHTEDKKVVVFKRRRRKGYRRKGGHTRQLTVLRVLDVVHDSEHASPEANPLQ